MKRYKSILYLTILFLVISFLLLFFNQVDIDFKISFDSLLNILLIIFIVYCLLVILVIYDEYKRKSIIKKQIAVFSESDYIIDELEDEEVLVLLHTKLNNLKSNIAGYNSRQDKWVHDIKIPLATLKLFIENKRSEFNYEDIRTLELISIDIENDLNKKIVLDKIEAEIDDYHIEKVNLNEIISKVIKKFRPSFMLKNLSISIEMVDINVISDRKSLKYCFEQIIMNAIKYSYDKTNIKIYIENNRLIFENKGLEIGSQNINRIYEFGYTGLNAVNKGMESTGIGLYMVKKSLDALGHTIVITSKDEITKVMIEFNKLM